MGIHTKAYLPTLFVLLKGPLTSPPLPFFFVILALCPFQRHWLAIYSLIFFFLFMLLLDRTLPVRVQPKTMSIARFFSFFTLAGFAHAKICYRQDGTAQDPTHDWQVCFPDAEVSHCCSTVDYCADNGLCINAGVSNNHITVQGCTDVNWGKPCQRRCQDKMGMYMS